MNSPRNTVAVRKQTRHPTSAALFQSLAPQKVIQQLPVQFASALAHEIRNPLANIQLAVEILKPTLSDQDQHLYLDIIMRGSERINEVVAELLASFRTGKRQKKHESVHKLLDEVLAMTGDRIALKNIKVRKDYSTVDCKVMMDKPKVIIALTNIIINAIDAMPAVNGQLILATKSINDKCVLEIRDNGIGISGENLKNIFKPFFTNKPGGMGLGLPATREILLSNRARIKVRSKEGWGTRFIILFDRIRDNS